MDNGVSYATLVNRARTGDRAARPDRAAVATQEKFVTAWRRLGAITTADSALP